MPSPYPPPIVESKIYRILYFDLRWSNILGIMNLRKKPPSQVLGLVFEARTLRSTSAGCPWFWNCRALMRAIVLNLWGKDSSVCVRPLGSLFEWRTGKTSFRSWGDKWDLRSTSCVFRRISWIIGLWRDRNFTFDGWKMIL